MARAEVVVLRKSTFEKFLYLHSIRELDGQVFYTRDVFAAALFDSRADADATRIEFKLDGYIACLVTADIRMIR
jgi:hypothetical protein